MGDFGPQAQLSSKVAYLQDFNSLPPPRGGPGLHGDLVALACLKMADSMNEVANESEA